MRIRLQARRDRRGAALASALLVALVLASVLAAMMMIGASHKGETSTALDSSRAFYLAEAGVSECVVLVSGHQVNGTDVPAAHGTANAPIELRNGSFWCTLEDHGDGSYTVTATGQAGLQRRTVEARLDAGPADIYDHAIFAGNATGDSGYTLGLSGSGDQGDEVEGNVYSGNDLAVSGSASVEGDVQAHGAISGIDGETDKTYALPDIAGMDYANNHDFDIAGMFASGDATWESSALGGSAWQMPEESPAHIFRKNPDDRLDAINSTAKDDYFLEDPHTTLHDYFSEGSMSGHTISLSGMSETPGPVGTDKVYYVDGNLWISNNAYSSMRIKHTSSLGMRVTFVVKGNVYFGDDITLVNPVKDGMAFIAIEDPLEPDSGNVYLGDPTWGTLEEIDAYIYAENDFYDNNLDAGGSKEVEIKGNMTAGNHVLIERDYVHPDGSVDHSKLSVEWDPRVANGKLKLPGLPKMGPGWGGTVVEYLREVQNP